jgi:2-polyprenyl-6-methoxyphenol hydroxylase-like FAD-dependent oxidoreductase
MENGFSAINNAASTGRKVDPLKVIIAGAGIGGLSAAVALRKAGHVVEVNIYMSPSLKKGRLTVLGDL